MILSTDYLSSVPILPKGRYWDCVFSVMTENDRHILSNSLFFWLFFLTCESIGDDVRGARAMLLNHFWKEATGRNPLSRNPLLLAMPWFPLMKSSSFSFNISSAHKLTKYSSRFGSYPLPTPSSPPNLKIDKEQGICIECSQPHLVFKEIPPM